MARNKAINLHDHLFAQLERLGEEDLTDEELNREFKRADAMSKVATTIIKNGQLVINACRMAEETGMEIMPDMLSSDIGGIKRIPKNPLKQLDYKKRV